LGELYSVAALGVVRGCVLIYNCSERRTDISFEINFGRCEAIRGLLGNVFLSSIEIVEGGCPFSRVILSSSD